MLNVERWAELRRLHFIEKVGVRELARRFGIDRNTVRRAIRSTDPPRYARAGAPSKLDPFTDEIHRRLKDDPRLPVVRLRELLQPLGYEGGETILKEHVREIRPLFLPVRTYQRTLYVPGELAQCDLWEPRREIPVGYGQTRRGYVVTVTLCWSRVSAGTLIFSKEALDIEAGLLRCLVRLGGLPEGARLGSRGRAPRRRWTSHRRVRRVLWPAPRGLALPRAARPRGQGRRGAGPPLHAHQLRAGAPVRLAA